MKDIFKQETIEYLQDRVNTLDQMAKPLWGKMSIYQMVKHCSENERMLLREKSFRRLFMGRLFGKLALRSNIKNDEPMKKHNPTHPDLKITEEGDVERQKMIWLSLLAKYPTFDDSKYGDFIHPFFGKMTKGAVGKFAFKHIDHHLRQFGV